MAIGVTFTLTLKNRRGSSSLTQSPSITLLPRGFVVIVPIVDCLFSGKAHVADGIQEEIEMTHDTKQSPIPKRWIATLELAVAALSSPVTKAETEMP